MVDAKEQTREAIVQMLLYIEGLGQFEGKQKLVYTLIDLEWSLRSKEPKIEKIEDEIPEELNGGHESGWGG